MSHVRTTLNRVTYTGMFSKIKDSITVFRDSVQDAKTKLEARKSEIDRVYIPGTPTYKAEREKAEKAFQAALDKNREVARSTVAKEIDSYRKTINDKVRLSTFSHVAEISLISKFEGLTQAEFEVLVNKYRIGDSLNYWDSRLLSQVAKENGLQMPVGCEFSNLEKQMKALDEIETSTNFYLFGGSNKFLTGADADIDIPGYDGTENYFRNLAVSDQRFMELEGLFLKGYRPLSPAKLAKNIYGQAVQHSSMSAAVSFLENRLSTAPDSIKVKVFKRVYESENDALKESLSASDSLGQEYDSFVAKSAEKASKDAGKAEETAGADKG